MNAVIWAAKRVREEMTDAMTYAKKAIEFKDSMPELAAVMEALSAQEFEHANKIYNSIKSGDGKEVLEYEYDFLKDEEYKLRELWEDYKEKD